MEIHDGTAQHDQCLLIITFQIWFQYALPRGRNRLTFWRLFRIWEVHVISRREFYISQLNWAMEWETNNQRKDVDHPHDFVAISRTYTPPVWNTENIPLPPLSLLTHRSLGVSHSKTAQPLPRYSETYTYVCVREVARRGRQPRDKTMNYENRETWPDYGKPLFNLPHTRKECVVGK